MGDLVVCLMGFAGLQEADTNASGRCSLTALVAVLNRSHDIPLGLARIAAASRGGEAHVEVCRGVVESSHALEAVAVVDTSVHCISCLGTWSG